MSFLEYEIFYVSEVIKKDIPKLDTAAKNQIQRSIEEKLLLRPEVFGIPLQKSLKNYRKLRVGDFRVIFRIENQSLKIFAIQHRSVVYKNLKNRV